jgi:integrase
LGHISVGVDNKEPPRDYYADDRVWEAVRGAACQELRDAMDIAYLTCQRPADVLKMRWSDIRDGALEIVQNKTGKKLRILIEDGSELARTLSRIRARGVCGMTIIATPKGERMSSFMRRTRFDAAREVSAIEAERIGDADLAARIRQFQFRDIRPKAASDDETLDHASQILGHSGTSITKRVYRRKGETVKPLK